jgi:hypothetical protein
MKRRFAMHRTRNVLLPVLLLVFGALAASAAGKPGDYLTRDGKLKEKLVLTDLQGGFAGFNGPKITIEPSGKWTRAKLVARRETVEKTGVLSKDQLATLAKELARYDLRALKSHKESRGANPHVVTLTFGKKEVRLTLKTGAALPKPGKTVPGRFGGIATAVEKLIAPKKAPK